MQNRESAVRSRQKKKESTDYLKTENEILKKENYRLYQENSFFKKEKIFLIDQIKFMQNLIKSNNMSIVHNNCSIEREDLEKNKLVKISSNEAFSPTSIVLNGERQKPMMKLFSVFLICMLSIFYISANISDIDSNEQIVFNRGSTITLNDDGYKTSSSMSSSRGNIRFMSLYMIFKVFFIILVGVFLIYLPQIWIWFKNKFQEKSKNINKNL